jgi:hypothetical protein
VVRLTGSATAVRHQPRWQLAGLAVGAVLVLGSCTGSPATPSGSTSSGPTVIASPSQTGPLATDLRGNPIDFLSCRARANWAEVAPITGAVQEYVFCGFKPGSDNFRELVPTRTVTPSNGRVFAAWTAVLAKPDVKRRPNQPCDASLIAYPPVLVRTSDGTWAVHLPTDRCGNPLPAVVRQLEAITR